ncbi:hypothetical protein Ccrd_009690 [Cynara cardunculus var. scolymus]|uniref:Glutamine amidotransferase type-2 domain-containing protein n=1 Tax=Cynara cardunculus var. scolymus TaxID=59895 RepID=A0A103YMQ2_CYNCS|nr:hypothetical protein Ccrd_009690 [Cynara cardunculus var. scolymus]
MCGILAVLGCSDDSQAKRARVLQLSRRQPLKHRGPDWSGFYQHDDCYISHQRLAIVDPASGDQPLYNEDKSIVVTYEEYGENFVDMLDGMFSFVLLDTHDNSFISARDAIGITSLYIGWGLDGSVWISSELKGLNDECEHFEVFPPGHLNSSKLGGFKRWYNPPWFSETIPLTPYDSIALRRALEDAVIKRLMTDVPFGVLLSGGLDSSLVASIMARHLSGTVICIPIVTPYVYYMQVMVAENLYSYLITTPKDGIDAIEDVIYHIETYDVTTVRASTPMFLMARKIKSLGVKMVISGEGADEIFGGANKSTSAWGLELRVPFLDKEFINVVMSIDPEMKMIDMEKNRIEKWILRRAFDDEDRPYLPKHILYRQKEQFSDGVGYSWIDGLKDHAELQVTDKMMLNATHIFPHNTPMTKEAYYYRMIFERFFPQARTSCTYYLYVALCFKYLVDRSDPSLCSFQNSAILTVPGDASVACSTAEAIKWDAAWSNHLDPSGRAALGVHQSDYEQRLVPVKSTTKVVDNGQKSTIDKTVTELTMRS